MTTSIRFRPHRVATAISSASALFVFITSPVCSFIGPSPRLTARTRWKNRVVPNFPTSSLDYFSDKRRTVRAAIRLKGTDGIQEDKGGTATIPNEIFNLVKCIVGAGVLSLSAGVAAFGSAPSALIPASFLIAVMGATSAYTFMLLARVSAMTGAMSYADAWNKTRGKGTAWIIAASSVLDCFAGNLTYSMVLADTFKALLSSIGIGITRTHALLGLTGSALLPLCLVRDLSALAPFSLVGITGMLYTAVAIGIRYFGGAYAIPAGKLLTDIPSHLHPTFGSVGAMGALSPKSLILVCMLSTAYIAHFNAIKFYKELKNNTMERFNVVVTSSFGVAIALYVAVASMGFLTFGSTTAGMILNNYSTSDGLISLSRFAVAVSLVFSYPLLFVGTREGLFDLIQVPEERRNDSLFVNQISIGLVTILTGLAVKINDLTFVASISGAVLGTALIFIYPTLMFRAAIEKLGDKATPRQRLERKISGAIAAVGVVIGGIGTNMALGTFLS